MGKMAAEGVSMDACEWAKTVVRTCDERNYASAVDILSSGAG